MPPLILNMQYHPDGSDMTCQHQWPFQSFPLAIPMTTANDGQPVTSY